MRSFFEKTEVIIIKKRLCFSDSTKRTVIFALSFPIISLILICAPDRLFLNYTLIGINARFLSPFLFLLFDLLVCYFAGIGFFGSDTCQRRISSELMHKVKMLMLLSLFFMHYWIFLFIFSMEIFVSFFCILASLFLSMYALLLSSRCVNLCFFSLIVVCMWEVSLLLLNLRFLFI